MLARFCIFILLSFVLVGCSGGSNQYPEVSMPNVTQETPDGSKLVFERDSSFTYMAAGVRVNVNGANLAKLSRGKTFATIVPAGKINIDVDTWQYPGKFGVSLNAEKGKTYYFKISPRKSSLLGGMTFGLLGGLADSKINSQSGMFKLELTSITN